MVKKKKSSTFIEDPVDSIVSHLGKFIDKTPEFFLGLTQSHPVVMTFFALMAITGVRMFLDPTKDLEKVGILNNLYVDIRNIGSAATVVPVVAGALPLISQAIAARGGGQ